MLVLTGAPGLKTKTDKADNFGLPNLLQTDLLNTPDIITRWRQNVKQTTDQTLAMCALIQQSVDNQQHEI